MIYPTWGIMMVSYSRNVIQWEGKETLSFIGPMDEVMLSSNAGMLLIF
jgi:hypothetical protein